MSSSFARPAQTSARVKFLRVVDASAQVFYVKPEGNPTAMMTQAQFDSAIGLSGLRFDVGNVLKDMGKEFIVYDSTSLMHKAIYRLVSPVTSIGNNNEGDEDGNLYVKVWDDASGEVNVARVG
jgi:hypothetical protein